MEENSKKSVVNHFEAGSNCQVFNSSISGCVFAMPGSNVTQNSTGMGPSEPISDERPAYSDIPEVLAESELWERLKDWGLVNEEGQPTVSRPEAALMADMISVKLGIAHKWKLFEKLWHRNNMRGDYNTALEQRKSLVFQEKLKNILG